MTQEILTRKEREQRASNELAEQLDALSRPMAERALGRAIELDSEARAAAEAAADTIDYDMLRDVALEVGISEESLKKALLEEFNTEKDHGARPVERATVPDTVRGGVIVSGLVEEVAQRLSDYLEKVEGLEEKGRSGPRAHWAPPKPRQAFPAQTWTVTQGRNDRQLVEIDIDTGGARKTFWRWVLAIIVLSTLFGSPLGGFVALGIFVAGVATVVGWIKRIGRKARRSINRTLGALADDGSTEVSRTWLDVWERLQQR
ncbi:MAG: hypothetical protein GY720_16395 [bacterium]|nr:hypothetical protein [bacterium]